MNYVAVADVKLKSGGTSHCWFHTDKTEIDKSLMEEFLSKYPEIKKVVSIGIHSKEMKNGFPVFSIFWGSWHRKPLR